MSLVYHLQAHTAILYSSHVPRTIHPHLCLDILLFMFPFCFNRSLLKALLIKLFMLDSLKG